ncbi:MAG: putative bifunctional diguanylate cyclase/phosphodiesterase, partial [Candidatus Methylomirabilales bacterium]
LQTPLYLAGRPQVVGGSLGLVVSDSGEESAEELLRNADVAMYMAKGEGKGRYAVFEPAMHASMRVRLELTADLQRALDGNQFILHYQPTVDLTTERVLGAEALVRWNHPTRGLIAPGEFIQIAEETGLIVPLGWWVLEEACRQGMVWQARYAADPPLTISVNLSMRQLHDSDVVERVAHTLHVSGLTPTSLVLEITESALMLDAEWTIGRLREVKGLGVQIALDDFGTGYSSLSYLQRLPVDILKIDRSFVAGVARGTEESALAHAIIRLGSALHLQVIAEGVEHHDQLVQLRALGCRRGQGFYFAHPMTVKAMADVLRSGTFDRAQPRDRPHPQAVERA